MRFCHIPIALVVLLCSGAWEPTGYYTCELKFFSKNVSLCAILACVVSRVPPFPRLFSIPFQPPPRFTQCPPWAHSSLRSLLATCPITQTNLKLPLFWMVSGMASDWGFTTPGNWSRQLQTNFQPSRILMSLTDIWLMRSHLGGWQGLFLPHHSQTYISVASGYPQKGSTWKMETHSGFLISWRLEC